MGKQQWNTLFKPNFQETATPVLLNSDDTIEAHTNGGHCTREVDNLEVSEEDQNHLTCLCFSF